MKALLCCLCDQPMDISADKRGFPYANCFGCGVQVFIRRTPSKKVFTDRYGTGDAAPVAPEGAEPKEPVTAATEPEPKKGPRDGKPDDKRSDGWL